MWPRQCVMGSGAKRYTHRITDGRRTSPAKPYTATVAYHAPPHWEGDGQAQSGAESSQMIGTMNGCVWLLVLLGSLTLWASSRQCAEDRVGSNINALAYRPISKACMAKQNNSSPRHWKKQNAWVSPTNV